MKYTIATLPCEKLYPAAPPSGWVLPVPGELDRERFEVLGIDAMPPVVVSENMNEQGTYEIYQGVITWRLATEKQIDSLSVRLASPTDAERKIMQKVDYAANKGVDRVRRVLRALHDGQKPAEIARRNQIDRTLVWKWRKLNKLCRAGWKLLEEGSLPVSHAVLIAGYDLDTQVDLLLELKDKRISYRELKKRAQKLTEGVSINQEQSTQRDPNIVALEQRATEVTGLPCHIQIANTAQKGRIAFDFYNLDELDNLLIQLKVKELEANW